MARPASQLFRPEAVRCRLQAEGGRGIVRVAPPWTWALLLVLLSALGTALLGALLGKVEVNGRGRAILRPRSGIRMLLAQLDGTVGRVEARSGQPVQAGSVLLRIEAPPVQAQLLEARRQLETVRGHFRLAAGLQDQAHGEQSRRLRTRMAKLEEQLGSQRHSIARVEGNLRRHLALEQAGIVSPAAVDQIREGAAQARREAQRLEQALEQAAQERAALAGSRQESLWQRRQTIRAAEARVEALAFMLGQTTLEAPEDGVVEAMLVKPGELLRAGQALCKLIPREAPLHVVAFLAEQDRAFVRPGDEVRLELDQLPYAEFGTLRARVERISDDLAAPFEIREALGENPLPGGPAFRVELAITDAAAVARAGIPLRPGMLMNARFTLRRQRLVTLVLDPLRKWLR
jgi:membrane fusion protein